MQPLTTTRYPLIDEVGLSRGKTSAAVPVRPELVEEVAFTEWTVRGRLRHRSWKGLLSEHGHRSVVVDVEPDSVTST
jgi:bifunctional non-homologous end joining protein LigD